MKRETQGTTIRVSKELEFKSRLQRLGVVKRLFLIPLFAWLGIVGIDFLVSLWGFGISSWLRLTLGKIVFYTLPIILLYLAGVTFYCSYRVLESRVHKNLAAFLFFQFLSYYLVDQLGIEMPSLSKFDSAVLTASIAIIIVILAKLVEKWITIPEVPKIKDSERKSFDADISGKKQIPSGHRAGMVVSSIFSLVIASLIHFRSKSGIAFVSWGVFFGVLLTMIWTKPNHLLLSFLYFIQPDAAESLFMLLQVRGQVEDQRNDTEIERELTILQKEEINARALRLANVLDQALHEARFADYKVWVEQKIEQLKDSSRLSAAEKERIVNEIEAVIMGLRSQKDILISPPNESGVHKLPEKTSLTKRGQSQKEINEAIASGLINKDQGFLFTGEAWKAISQGINDVEAGRLIGNLSIKLANSVDDAMTDHPAVVDCLVQHLTNKPEVLKPIVGRDDGLEEIRFKMVVKSYCAVVQKSGNNIFVIAILDDNSEKSG